jgi:Tol biopolymer transport system component
LISIETGEKCRLTIVPKSVRSTTPAFSPDGRYLSFARESGVKSDIYLLRLTDGFLPQGEPEKVTSENPRNFGIAWMPDGGEIVFGSGTITTFGLFRIAAFKPSTPRQLAFGQENASAPAISLRGNRLAYAVGREDVNIWRVDLKDTGQKPGAPVRLIASTREDTLPAYSPDGEKIAFLSDRSGTMEIWVCDNDGSNPMPLTSMGGPIVSQPNWSPDGKTIAFCVLVPGEGREIYLINAEGGVPRRIAAGLRNSMWPSWSRDGQSLYVTGGRNNTWGVWKIPSTGGEAVQITRNGGDVPQESPDGKYVYLTNDPVTAPSVWRIPVEGGEEVKVLDAVGPGGLFTVAKNGIYFLKIPDKKGHSDLCLYVFATGKSRKILTVEREVPSKIAVSPDGKTILYPQVDEAGSDLMLVENFR